MQKKMIAVLSRAMFFKTVNKHNINENNVESLEKDGLYIISINDPEGDNLEPDFVSKNKSNVLSMQFGDFRIPITKSQESYLRNKGHNIFDDSMAKQIIDFIKKIKDLHPDDFTLLIHCHAGVSRSAAVGLYAFMELSNGTVQEFEFQNPNTAYNPIIFEKLITLT